MSALTFETLSAELTQALGEQRTIPPKTVARCTLGRNKVLVLVEFPLDSAKAEAFASQTLGWLEQNLRDRFDTKGLPDEVADISADTEGITVQLYLKHQSEAKPFTMRSFTWKVGDGFDELFGSPAESAYSETNQAGLADETRNDTSLEDMFGTEDEPSAAGELDAEDESRRSQLEDNNDLFSLTPSTPPVPPPPSTDLILPDVVSDPLPDILPEGEEERVLLELGDDDLQLDGDDLPLDLDVDDDSDIEDSLDEPLAESLLSDNAEGATLAADLITDSDFDPALAADTELT
ncbi:MAG: hypothetical protein AAFY54_15675, partial [Cyanobacteria bacterium J06648_10]